MSDIRYTAQQAINESVGTPRRQTTERAVHPILIMLSVGDPFWTVWHDLQGVEHRIESGGDIMAYSVRPTMFAGLDGVPIRINPRHFVCAVLFPAIPRADGTHETD